MEHGTTGYYTRRKLTSRRMVNMSFCPWVGALAEVLQLCLTSNLSSGPIPAGGAGVAFSSTPIH